MAGRAIGLKSSAEWNNNREGHIAKSENSKKYRKVEAYLYGKECSDGSGNSANRKVLIRRFSSLVLFFSQLVLDKILEPIKVVQYLQNHGFCHICCTEIKDMCDFVSINQPQIGGRLIENELPRLWRSNVEKIKCTVINAFMTKPPEKVRSKNIHSPLQIVVHNAKSGGGQCVLTAKE